jgi:hypothetical protein
VPGTFGKLLVKLLQGSSENVYFEGLGSHR